MEKKFIYLVVATMNNFITTSMAARSDPSPTPYAFPAIDSTTALGYLDFRILNDAKLYCNLFEDIVLGTSNAQRVGKQITITSIRMFGTISWNTENMTTNAVIRTEIPMTEDWVSSRQTNFGLIRNTTGSFHVYDNLNHCFFRKHYMYFFFWKQGKNCNFKEQTDGPSESILFNPWAGNNSADPATQAWTMNANRTRLRSILDDVHSQNLKTQPKDWHLIKVKRVAYYICPSMDGNYVKGDPYRSMRFNFKVPIKRGGHNVVFEHNYTSVSLQQAFVKGAIVMTGFVDQVVPYFTTFEGTDIYRYFPVPHIQFRIRYRDN